MPTLKTKENNLYWKLVSVLLFLSKNRSCDQYRECPLVGWFFAVHEKPLIVSQHSFNFPLPFSCSHLIIVWPDVTL